MQNPLIKNAINFGVILGIIQIIFTMLLYVGGVEYLGDWKMGMLGLLIFLIAMIICAIKLKKLNGGFIEFKNIFGKLLLVFVVAGVVSTIMNILLYNVIDTELAVAMKESQIESTTAMMESFGAPEEAFENIEKGFEGFEEKFSVGGLFVQLIWSIIGGAILSAILGAIFKKTDNSIEE